MTSSMGHSEDQLRWERFTLSEQLANVGSEVERALKAHRDGQRARFDNALARALMLFDLTAADHRWLGPQKREVLRAREEFCRLFFDPAVNPDSGAGLSRYFLAFAVNAQRHRTLPESARGPVGSGR